MNCPKCNNRIEPTDKFCRNCGEEIKNEHSNQFNYSYNYSNQIPPSYDMNANHQTQYNYSYNYSTSQSSEDDIYIRAYVGQNYEKIKNTKFSIPNLFLGAYYLLYRKLWGYAIIYMLINIFLTFLSINIEEIANLVSIGINLFISFKFSDIYMKKVRTNVERIKNENLDKTSQELIELCRKKGGTSIAAPILTAIGIFIVSFIAAFILIFTNTIPNLEINNTKEESSEELSNTIEELTYEIPEGFELYYSYGDYKSYNYYNKDTFSSCYVTIETNSFTSLYPTAEIYLQENVFIDEDDTASTIKPITLNKNIWLYQTITSSYKTETHYSIVNNDIIYYINTSSYNNDNEPNKICSYQFNKFLNTLSFKNQGTNI